MGHALLKQYFQNACLIYIFSRNSDTDCYGSSKSNFTELFNLFVKTSMIFPFPTPRMTSMHNRVLCFIYRCVCKKNAND